MTVIDNIDTVQLSHNLTDLLKAIIPFKPIVAEFNLKKARMAME